MKILIVEDTQSVTDLLEFLIEKMGHQFHSVSTGQDALRIVQREVFDLVLLDIFLPDITAYDLIPLLKQAWSGMKIITMTGYSSREVEEKVRRQGILYYMVKPIDYRELESIIRHIQKNEKGSIHHQDEGCC